MAETGLQVRVRLLELRERFLSGTLPTRQEEEEVLAEIEAQVRQLAADHAAADASDGSERRNEKRIAAYAPAALRPLSGGGTKLGVARDVAPHGLSVVARYAATTGDKLRVDLGLGSGRRLAVTAEVRWTTPVWTHPGHHVLGLRYLESEATPALAR